MNNRLFLFTATFPFGTRETFLEVEICYLAEVFEVVTIVPLGGYGTPQREVPDNCTVETSLHCSRNKKLIKSLGSISRVLPLYSKDLWQNRVFLSLKKLKIWSKQLFLTSFYLQSSVIRNLLKVDSSDIIIYSYWGTDYNCFFPWLKGRYKLYSRFHGEWDLWRNGGASEGYIPCRKAILESLTTAITISHKGEEFLSSRYPWLSIKTFHLGTEDNGVGMKSNDGIIRVVSCSSVYPLKRVPLIYNSLVLAAQNQRIEWTHIGGGPYFESLKALVSTNSDSNLIVHLLGPIPMQDVLSYYNTHPVDVFVNLSTNEGIPVSIMEAISFNIPIIATNVGGNSEIVTSETGILVQADPSIQEVASSFEQIFRLNLDPRLFWEREFKAMTNYMNFTHAISS